LTYANLYCERDADLVALCSDCHWRMHDSPVAANDNKQIELVFDAMDKKDKQ
jgi:hypothetical protein